MPCSITGCTRTTHTRGWCNTHYQRWRRTGSTELATRADRFWAKVDKSGDCWIWTAGKNAGGYGTFSGGSTGSSLAHRWAYESEHGPTDRHLDHLCHTRDPSCAGGDTCPHRACVNPAHLEPVELVENSQRGRHPWMSAHINGTCINGHVRTEANTFTDSGSTICTDCHPFDRSDPDHTDCKRCIRARNSVYWADPANRRKTHCKNGHAFTPENTYIRPDTGSQQCKACGLARRRAA